MSPLMKEGNPFLQSRGTHAGPFVTILAAEFCDRFQPELISMVQHV